MVLCMQIGADDWKARCCDLDTFQLRDVRVIGLNQYAADQDLTIVIENGIVTYVGPEPNAEISPVIDGRGSYVSLGWIDLHGHFYYGATDIGVRPDTVGFNTGVHHLVDAGSAGEANFAGLEAFVIGSSEVNVLAYINIGPIGVTAANRISEYAVLEAVELERLYPIVEQYRRSIRGIKARVSGIIVGERGMEVLQLGQEASRVTQLPLVVHVGEGPPDLAELFAAMEPGSMATHCYHGKPGNSVLDRRIRDAMRAAAARGVLLDVGHGEASFSYAAAELCIAEGLLPFSISTDVHARNVNGPVWDLPTTMAKLLAVGLSLDDVIRCVTVQPSSFLQIPGYREKLEGTRAQLTLFSLDHVDVEMPDSRGDVRRLQQAIVPRAVVVDGCYRRLEPKELASPLFQASKT